MANDPQKNLAGLAKFNFSYISWVLQSHFLAVKIVCPSSLDFYTKLSLFARLRVLLKVPIHLPEFQ